MQQIVDRIDAMRASLIEVRNNVEDRENWQRLEFCYLQARLICEYTALAVLCAHQEYGTARSKKLEKEWHAARLIERVSHINEYAFPIPVKMLHDFHAAGHHHIEALDPVISPTDLADFYGKAGDILHVGSLGRILKGRQPPYNVTWLMRFLRNIIKTLNSHMIRLPHIGSVLIVQMKDEVDGKVHCAFGDTDGSFVMEGTLFNVEEIT